MPSFFSIYVFLSFLGGLNDLFSFGGIWSFITYFLFSLVKITVLFV